LDGLIVSVAAAPLQTRHQLVHRLDGRYGPLQPSEIARLAERLVGQLDLRSIDVVVGIPEGGTIPAFAVAQCAGLPLALATRTDVDLPRRLSFDEPHVPDLPPFHFYGLEPGTRVAIVEDEVTTGRTIVNAVRALRAGGVDVRAVGSFIVVDNEATWGRLEAADIHLEACLRIGGDFLARVGADGA
jgi:adenine/guanine phosphoribosyltransferase-like PRPP-binding protein